MSVNRFYKNPSSPDKELELIASKGQRTFVGTKAAVQAAMEKGDIGNASLVYITDDYAENRIPELISDDTVNISGNKVAFLDKGGFVAKATNATTADKLLSNNLGEVTAEENLNNLKTGVYYMNAKFSPVDVPADFGGICSLFVRESGNYTNQTIIEHWSQRCFFRIKNSKGWNNWKQFSMIDETVESTKTLPEKSNLDNIRNGYYNVRYNKKTSTHTNMPPIQRDCSLGKLVQMDYNLYGSNTPIQIYFEANSLNDFSGQLYVTNAIYTRTKGVSWSEWRPLITTENQYSAIRAKHLPNDTDLDTLKTPGEYYIHNYTSSNAPSGVPTEYNYNISIIGNTQDAEPNRTIKQFLRFGGGYNSIFFRSLNANLTTWNSWVQLVPKQTPAQLSTYNEGITKEI